MNNNILIDREKYLGGSEIASMLGISPFQTRFELLQSKIGLGKQQIENYYMHYGHILEPQIREYINNTTEYTFVETTTIKELKNGIIDLRYNADGQDASKSTLLEIKTTSNFKENRDEYKIYLVQLIYGMYLTKSKNGLLAVYVRDDSEVFNKSNLYLYDLITTDDVIYYDTLKEILSGIDEFIIDLKRLQDNPLLSEADFIKNQDLVKIGNQIAELDIQLNTYRKLIDQYEQLKTNLLNAMQENNVKKIDLEKLVISKIDGKPETTKNIFDETTFKKDHSDLWEQYQIEKKVNATKAYLKIKFREEDEYE